MSYYPVQQTGNQPATGSHNAATTQLEISVSCTDLRDKDAFSKSDPLCVMFHQSELHDMEFVSMGLHSTAWHAQQGWVLVSVAQIRPTEGSARGG